MAEMPTNKTRMVIERLLSQATGLPDDFRIEVANLHAFWKKGQTYGSNTYLRHGYKDDKGTPQLYRVTRQVTNAQIPPDQPQNPAAYEKI